MNVLSQAPWAADTITNRNRAFDCFAVRAGARVVAYVPVGDNSLMDRARVARRIAACINACEGLSTEQLEGMVAASGHDVLSRAYDVCSHLWEWHGIELVGDHPIAGTDAVDSLSQIGDDIESVVSWAREQGLAQ